MPKSWPEMRARHRAQKPTINYEGIGRVVDCGGGTQAG